jgi:hypothetical protein
MKLHGLFTGVDRYGEGKLYFDYIGDPDGNAIPTGELVCRDRIKTAADRLIDEAVAAKKQRGEINAANPYRAIPTAETGAELDAAPPRVVVPYTDTGFKVVLTRKTVPPDILKLVGCECTIWVAPRRSTFASKLDRNRGQEITNIALVLTDIKRGVV